MAEPDCLTVYRLGLRDYHAVWRAMAAFTNGRDGASGDELWLVQHPAVFTQGQAGKAEHLLMPGDIPVIQVDRGGQVTYHGPGQLVAYPLIDLRRRKLGVRDLVQRIENILIETLAAFGVQAQARQGAPGVYVGEAKIASLGLRVRRGCSFHGLSLNVDMDLSPFERINPCGYAGLKMTQLADLVDGKVDFGRVEGYIVDYFVRRMGYAGWRARSAGCRGLAESTDIHRPRTDTD